MAWAGREAFHVYDDDKYHSWELAIPEAFRTTLDVGSPDGGHHSETDHIIVSKRLSLTDVAVVPKFYKGSDHRLLCERFSSTWRREKVAKRLALIKRHSSSSRTIIDFFASFVGFWKDTVIDKIDDEYEPLLEHLHNCAREVKSFKTTKRRLSPETLEPISSEREVARTAGNKELQRRPQRENSRSID
ncbi:hypothetical protein RB195_018428 [Necator americanus]|uniref:Endonuclease/exonuclease/phosphatase domain-containing protein n=1 Tax=Necator americanus TaxID=51031 RepID=A0ABR1C9T3_NECAM